jgi:hypothetical protein
MHAVCGFEVGSIGTALSDASFNPMVFFDDPVLAEDDAGSPIEVLEIEGAGSETSESG